MNTQTLLQQIASGEDSTRQFKADVTNGESLASELVAFANSEGGTIYIGAADDGTTPGLALQDVARINQLIGNVSSQQVRSPIAVTTENVRLENGRIVIVVTVPKGIMKPYFDKNGEVPETIASNPCVLSQKDLDAEWAKKGNDTFFGFKNHAAGDDEFKLIRGYGVTGAATHDSKPYMDVMPEEPAFDGQKAYGDSAYSGEKIDAKLKGRGYDPQICEKGYRNKPLTEEQKENNRVKSKTRCRVEHIFGSQKMRMGDEILRSIGFARARFWIGMRNLMYNMSRLVSLKRQ